MLTTIHFAEHGVFFLSSRDDIHRPACQALIRLCKGSGSVITCGCKDDRPPLKAYPVGDAFTLKSHLVNDHAETCVVCGESTSIVQVRPTGNIFDPAPRHDDRMKVDDDTDGQGEPVLTFRGYVGRVLSNGIVEAWRRHFESGRPRPNPPAKATIAAIDMELRTQRFDSGEPGTVVARKRGLRLVHGLVERTLPPERLAAPGQLPLYAFVATGSGDKITLMEERLWIEASTLLTALRESQRFDHFTCGPYYAVACVQGTLVTRLVLRPVFFDGMDLVFVDSGKERFWLNDLLCRGIAHLKPTHVRELIQLAAAVAELAWLAELPRGCRPDVVTLGPPERSVMEMTGGIETEAYVKRLAQKRTLYPRSRAGVPYREVRGESFPSDFLSALRHEPGAIPIQRHYG